MRIPEHYVVRASRNEIGGQRNISVRRYATTIPFDRETISKGVQNSRLVYGAEFGIIETYDLDSPDQNIRALCGLVGERNLVLLNEETNDLDYIRIKHVILSVIMVEFLANENGQLELLVYGGTQGRNQLWEMLKYNFDVNPEPQARYFRPEAVRSLCETYFECLTEINIDPFEEDGWGTIKLADFKSYRGNFILPSARRMREIKDNKNIAINSFESILFDQLMNPMLKPCNVKFRLLRDSGISMTIPELELPINITDIAYEIHFYDFARQCYNTIIGSEQMFSPIPSGFSQQLSLLD